MRPARKVDGAFKHFELIESDIDPAPFLDEIASVSGAWDMQKGRQKKIVVQREAKSIPIRGLVKSKINGRKKIDVHESRFTTISKQFPIAVGFLKEFAKRRRGKLSRAKLVCLPSGHRVYPHNDQGEYYRIRNRFHLVLQSNGGWLKAGDEQLYMRVGELWWFDNNQIHEAFNDGDIDRVHFIFDLLET